MALRVLKFFGGDVIFILRLFSIVVELSPFTGSFCEYLIP